VAVVTQLLLQHQTPGSLVKLLLLVVLGLVLFLQELRAEGLLLGLSWVLVQLAKAQQLPKGTTPRCRNRCRQLLAPPPPAALLLLPLLPLQQRPLPAVWQLLPC